MLRKKRTMHSCLNHTMLATYTTLVIGEVRLKMSNLKQDSLTIMYKADLEAEKIVATKPMETQRDLSLAYSPG